VTREWVETPLGADDEWNRLRLFARLVSDLDRSPNGRHEGDAEVQDPTGVSQGNPHIREGVVFGYTMGGRPIRMPPRELRDDPEAWIGTVEP